MIDSRTGETVRYMQNDIISLPTIEKGARLYVTKTPIWIASMNPKNGVETKQRLFVVDYTDPAAPFVRSMFVAQLARIDEEGTTAERRKQGKLAFTDIVNTKIHKSAIKNKVIEQLCAGKILTVADTKIVKVHKYDQTTQAYLELFEDRTAYSWAINDGKEIDDDLAVKLITETIESLFTQIPTEQEE